MFLIVSGSHFIRQQLIAELQTSVCDSKEEAVRLQQVMEKQLKEVNVRWDEERQTITHHADQASKVCVGTFISSHSNILFDKICLLVAFYIVYKVYKFTKF